MGFVKLEFLDKNLTFRIVCMDALTVLSICDTGLVLLVRAEKQCAVWLHCLVFTTLIIWLSILHIIFGIGVEEEGV